MPGPKGRSWPGPDRYLASSGRGSERRRSRASLVDSPGGTVTDSDQLLPSSSKRVPRGVGASRWRPTSTPSAASGGYYVWHGPAERVFMHPTGITGSIGVILGTWNYSEAAEEARQSSRVTILSDRTPYKDILERRPKPVRGRRDHDTPEVARRGHVRAFCGGRLDAGRPELPRERVIELADGRIYSAQSGGPQPDSSTRSAALERGRRSWVRDSAPASRAVRRAIRYEASSRHCSDSADGGPKSPEERIAWPSTSGLLDPSPKLLYLWTGALLMKAPAGRTALPSKRELTMIADNWTNLQPERRPGDDPGHGPEVRRGGAPAAGRSRSISRRASRRRPSSRWRSWDSWACRSPRT